MYIYTHTSHTCIHVHMLQSASNESRYGQSCKHEHVLFGGYWLVHYSIIANVVYLQVQHIFTFPK